MTSETLEEYKARVARSGGHARAKKLTREERAESARVAAQARWKEHKKTMKKMAAQSDRNLAKLEKISTKVESESAALLKSVRARKRKA